MARQELSNVFQDGLMMDLNPINTPKSVLTDCLNGTYITYNGNEFVLQNDMGNYKLKNCKLPTNFIPVGVKGYGDILYIVSYNPITNETEIGSYPAPQSIFTTGETEDALEATPDRLAPFVWDGEVEYPTIIRTNKKPIFIFTDSNEETYKLNPGDEFKFSGELTQLDFIYQHLNFYVIDEDNKLYDIDDTQIYNENNKLVSQEMRKVFWETPGWLAAQYDLYVPDKFNLNLRSLNVPEFLVAQSDDEASSQAEDKSLDELEPDKDYFKVSMDLSSQTIITDKLFQTELDKNFGHDSDPDLIDTYDNLFIRYLIKQNQNPPKEGEDDYGTFKGIVVSIDNTHTKDYTNGVTEGDYVYYDIPVWKHNYQDDIITAYNNIRPIWFCNNPETLPNSEDLDIANYHGVVELTAYPIIKYNGLTLKYTQFSTTQRFPLNTLKNSSNITIADSIYKWSVDDDSCTISFNINGPFINASDITGRYEVYRINLFNNDKWPNINTKPNLNNPESYSQWNSSELYKLTTKEITNDKNGVWTTENWGTGTHYTELTRQEKLLMCKGNIPNLVLYGQNTLNIDWDDSNKIILKGYQNRYTNPDFGSSVTVNSTTIKGYVDDSNYDGSDASTKTIDFSKEGGIYIFRVILEQNGSQLAESKRVLIPSEVFNEWFGSIDNYLDETNGITSSMWVGKWLDHLNISSVILNNLTPVLLDSLEEIPAEYKSRTETDWKNIIINKDTSIYELLPKPDGTTYGYTEKIDNALQIRIKYSDLLQISSDIFPAIQKLKGSLWNDVFSYNIQLKSGSDIKLEYSNNQFKLSEAYITWEITYTTKVSSVYEEDSHEYLFKKMFNDNNAPAIEFGFTNENLERDNASHQRKNYNCYYRYNDKSSISDSTISGKKLGEFHTKNTGNSRTDNWDANNSFLTNGITALDNLDYPFAWLKLRAQGYNVGTGSNYEKIFNRGPVWQRDPVLAIYRAKEEWSNEYNQKKLLCMRAANKAGTQQSLIVLYSDSTTFDDATVQKDLEKLRFIIYKNSKKTYYYITNYTKFDNLYTSYIINKFDVIFNLNFLRTDDYIWNKTSNTIIENCEILDNKQLTLNLSKSQYNGVINNVSFKYNFLDIPIISTIDVVILTGKMDNIIDMSKEEITNNEEVTKPGLYIKHDDGNITSTLVLNLVNGILSAQTNEAPSLKKIWFNNSINDMISGINTEDINSGTPTDNTGYVMYSYIQTL